MKSKRHKLFVSILLLVSVGCQDQEVQIKSSSDEKSGTLGVPDAPKNDGSGGFSGQFSRSSYGMYKAPLLTSVTLNGDEVTLVWEIDEESHMPSGGFDIFVNEEDGNEHLFSKSTPRTTFSHQIQLTSFGVYCYQVESRYLPPQLQEGQFLRSPFLQDVHCVEYGSNNVIESIGAVDGTELERPFNGARGFGTIQKGGLNGEVFFVTSLADKGPGTLRECVSQSGRLCVFEVSGVIELNSSLRVKSDTTIAGHTAPPPGINLHHESLVADGRNIVIQHIRVRVGDHFEGVKKGGALDAFNVRPSTDESFHENIVLDHCSTSWGIDENIGIAGGSKGGNVRNVTISNSIVGEGLNNTWHEDDGPHSMGILIGRGTPFITLHGNFLSSNRHRTPEIHERTVTQLVNNVIYNPGIHIGANINLKRLNHVEHHGIYRGPTYSVIVGNDFVRGPSSSSKPVGLTLYYPSNDDDNKVFMKGNTCDEGTGVPFSCLKDRSDGKVAYLPGQVKASSIEDVPVDFDLVEALPSDSNRIKRVLSNVGAFPRYRDSVDRRLLEDFDTGRSRIIDSQSEVGGYPKLQSNQRRLSDIRQAAQNNDRARLRVLLEEYRKQVEF